MDDGSPGLSVGFLIETGDSFGELAQLERAMGSAEAKIVADATRIESATTGMVKLAGSTAQVTTFGAAATREMRSVARETNAAERSAEGMVRQLGRQIEVFGKSASEVRRFRAELRATEAESRGLTELANRLRMASAEMDRLEASSGRVGGTVGRSRGSMMQFGMQLNDVATMAALGAPPMQIFASQIGQIVQVAQMAEGGVKGFVGEIGRASKAILIAAATNPYLLAAGAAIVVFAGAVNMLKNAANSTTDMEAYAKSLGLSADEIRKLDSVTVTFGDTAKAVFQVVGDAIWAQIGPAVTNAWAVMQDWASWIFTGVKDAANFLIGGFVGAYHAISKTWEMFPAALGDIFVSAVNGAITAINGLIKNSVEGLNSFISSANGILGQFGFKLPPLTAPEISQMTNDFKGAAKAAGQAGQAEMNKYLGVDYVGKFGNAVINRAAQNARDRIKGQAQEKGFLDPEKGNKEKAKGLSDAERAYESAVKTAKEYAAAQLDEAAKLGLTAKQLREYADAAAMAKAPTDELKKAIQDAAAVREKAYSAKAVKDFQANVMQPLRDELALYGLVGPARAAAALALEKQSFLTKNMDDGLEVATARWEEYYRIKSELIGKDAALEQEALRIERLNDALSSLAEQWDIIATNVQNAGAGMAEAFGSAGAALGNLASIYAGFRANQAQGEAEHIRRLQESKTAEQKANEMARYGLKTATSQIGLYGDMASAAKGFFKEKSAGYKAIMAAEKVFRAFEFAMSVRAMIQDVSETISSIANSGARATAAGAEGVATQAKLPFPLNIAAMAATAAALVAAGISILGSPGGGSNNLPQSNTGTGTVLGDGSAQSESITNAISALRDVDLLMLNSSRQMAASLKSIESNIGSFASLLVRNADSINASGGVAEGFNASGLGSILGKIPLIGGILKGLFGTTTSVVGSGLYGDSQSVGSILNGGFDAQYYSDVQKKKKFLGITTSNKFSTQFTGADGNLENQFTLILRSFNDAIIAAAGPLGASTNEIQQKLSGFVLNIGKIDLQGLTGEEIEEKLTAVFGAAADSMARAAFPLIDQFQRVGEGAFETLVRVASTIEAVGASFDMLGQNATNLSIAAKLGLADQFESISALTSAVDDYFQRFYTKEEQTAARTAQMASVFQSLGLSMPSTLAGFRSLVEAQNLNTAAGQAAYATLLQLAPAFGDLQTSMDGAKSAADIASERLDLQRQLLELQGDTSALRAMQLAKLDASNRELQNQIWAIQDAQAAAKAADELRKAWQSVGDSIMDEVRRIRALTDTAGGNSFAALMGQFNAASTAARGGDMDAAKTLPQLSQALLSAATDAATSRQELDRVRAQIAASLEATNSLIGMLAGRPATSNDALLESAAINQQGVAATNDNGPDSLSARFDELRAETEQMRVALTSALATIAANTGRVAKKLDDVTGQSGGDAIATVSAAA